MCVLICFDPGYLPSGPEYDQGQKILIAVGTYNKLCSCRGLVGLHKETCSANLKPDALIANAGPQGHDAIQMIQPCTCRAIYGHIHFLIAVGAN